MIKIDLHTHSTSSPDGSLSLEDYRKILSSGKLDYIAITDHDNIFGAREIKEKLGEKYGGQIIIGQEITTAEGEIIGLYLTNPVQSGLTAKATAMSIKDQGGLVYIPHPFETVRKGISKETLDGIADQVDIVETYNGRAFFQNKSLDAVVWARLHNKVGASSSDAHGVKGIGSSYTTVAKKPSVKNLVEQLATARLSAKRPSVISLLYPKLNRLRAKLR